MNNKLLFNLTICLLFLSVSLCGQTIIQMEKQGSLYVVPCKVNGLSLKFIFDTGASDVSISLTEALFMLKNGYLKEQDILGTERYKIANGEIIEGTRIILQEIEIAGIKLKYVEASVVNQMKAPLLLGQSAIQKLGKIQMDGSTLTILNRKVKSNESSFQGAIGYNKLPQNNKGKMEVPSSSAINKIPAYKLGGSSSIEEFTKEAYYRLQYDIRASHILVKMADSLQKDTVESYNKIVKIRSRIINGEDFNQVAMESGVSDDPSAIENGGDCGYFSALQMVYSFENIAYSTAVNQISIPFRTKFGYHIIKVVDIRKTRGEVLVAHIMVRTRSNTSKEDSSNSYSKISEVYNKLKMGNQKFDELAEQYSEDKRTANTGGVLPWFGVGKMVPEFESVSFALISKGDFSEPIKTKNGWHIIKLLDKRDLRPFEELETELATKITESNRFNGK